MFEQATIALVSELPDALSEAFSLSSYLVDSFEAATPRDMGIVLLPEVPVLVYRAL